MKKWCIILQSNSSNHLNKYCFPLTNDRIFRSLKIDSRISSKLNPFSTSNHHFQAIIRIFMKVIHIPLTATPVY